MGFRLHECIDWSLYFQNFWPKFQSDIPHLRNIFLNLKMVISKLLFAWSIKTKYIYIIQSVFELSPTSFIFGCVTSNHFEVMAKKPSFWGSKMTILGFINFQTSLYRMNFTKFSIASRVHKPLETNLVKIWKLQCQVGGRESRVKKGRFPRSWGAPYNQ